MIDSTIVLCSTAATVAFVHTVVGPDHYLPFVAMSRAGGWSMRKTILITLLCGVGHVFSSAILGLVGVTLGIAAFKLEWIEQFRGDIAGWLLLAFGLVYFLWGVRRAIRNQAHSHFHAHADGVIHAHEHTHHAEHLHVHAAVEPGGRATKPTSDEATKRRGDGATKEQRDSVRGGEITAWVLFTVFLFGPCEPLIPMLMYAAAKGSAWTVIGVTLVFGVITIATMLTVVLSSSWVVGIAPLPRWQRFGHALAGLVVLSCGVAVQAGL